MAGTGCGAEPPAIPGGGTRLVFVRIPARAGVSLRRGRSSHAQAARREPHRRRGAGRIGRCAPGVDGRCDRERRRPGLGCHIGRGPVLDCRRGRDLCVSAELSGFAPFSSDPVSVGQGATATLDVTLRLPTYGDTLVVTGSRAPEALRTAPVAVTVLRSAELENTPATNYSDLLRSVPGVNVIELSPRDVQIVTRGATGRNARSTLALLDGRSIYQDYFGMVLWDCCRSASTTSSRSKSRAGRDRRFGARTR